MSNAQVEAFGEFVTLEEFQRMPEENEYRVDLVRGRILLEPLQSAAHGVITTELAMWVHSHASQHGLGITLIGSGFLLSVDPPTVLGSDVGFIAADRLPVEGIPLGYWQGPPDLAVEVLSFENTAAWIQGKVLEYLESGTRLVWVVDPETRSAAAYRSREDICLLTEVDALEGDDVLPGFRLPLSELFAVLQPPSSP